MTEESKAQRVIERSKASRVTEDSEALVEKLDLRNSKVVVVLRDSKVGKVIFVKTQCEREKITEMTNECSSAPYAVSRYSRYT